MTSALLVGLIGPIYGGVILILGFPLVFRTKDRVNAGALLAAFGTTWLVLVGTGPAPLIRNGPNELWPLWVGVGLAGVLVGSLLLIHSRPRPR